MKLKLFLLIALVFLAACNSKNESTGSLELKTKTETQELDQVQVIGTRNGEIPPDFTVISSEGKVIRLSSLLEQKKPIIVYFMATWCPWCAKDYGALSKVYKKYGNDINFVSISLDLSENVLDLAEYKKKYPELQSMVFAQGNENVLRDYAVTKTTTKYAISRNGTIVYKAIGAFEEEQWNQLLDFMVKT